MDRRWEPRQLTLKTGKIRSVDLPSEVDCAILDISAGGARILVPDGVEIPATFDLAIDPDGDSHACRLRWKSGSRIGVAFQSPISP